MAFCGTDRPLIVPECAYIVLKGINAVIGVLSLGSVVVDRLPPDVSIRGLNCFL